MQRLVWRLLWLFACGAVAYDNGAMTDRPPLGWQTWCAAGPCGTDHCFDFQIMQTARAMVDNGMLALGYEWIVLDDCWHPTRDNTTGELVPYVEFFPHGMQPVIDYVHSLGMKFGLYTSVGAVTCHGGWSPGSFGHYEQDAHTFAAWRVDYVKMDWCGGDERSVDGHTNFSRALNATGRPIVLELCRGTYMEEDRWGYASSIAQIWRAAKDHHDSFDSTRAQVLALSNKATWSGPHGWAYGDMMMTGGQGCDDWDAHTPQHCPKQTDAEYRTEVSLYSVLSSPMMIGTDLRAMTPIMRELLLNAEVIAINQDAAATPGDLLNTSSCPGKSQSWVRRLSAAFVADADLAPGSTVYAVATPNFGDHDAEITVCLRDVHCGGAAHCEASLRDVWAQTERGEVDGQFTLKIASHDTSLLLATFAGDSRV